MKNKKILIILIFLLIIINILIQCIFSLQKITSKDDLIFFKLFGQNKSQTDLYNNYSSKKLAQNIYIFDVSYQNIDFKNINLVNTVNNKTLVNEKIAPGTKGEFSIVLTTNKNLKYNVKFQSKNKKPKNLVFSIKGKDKLYSELEKMQEDLTGNIKQGEEKIITILWQWRYESGKNEDLQDTKDGENLSKYNFDIYTIGGEYD